MLVQVNGNFLQEHTNNDHFRNIKSKGDGHSQQQLLSSIYQTEIMKTDPFLLKRNIEAFNKLEVIYHISRETK